jgi:Ca2+-dependent lipid-binding protein
MNACVVFLRTEKRRGSLKYNLLYFVYLNKKKEKKKKGKKRERRKKEGSTVPGYQDTG